jgi:hypothetical protein
MQVGFTLIGNLSKLPQLHLAEVVDVGLQLSQLRHSAAAPWRMTRRIFAPTRIPTQNVKKKREGTTLRT